VYGDARVYGNARVYGDAHYFNFTPFFGLTFFRTKQRVIHAWFGGELHVSFDALIAFTNKHKPELVAKLKLGIEMAKLHIDLTPHEDEVEICPICGAEIGADGE